jgi:2-methylcitrate dehydratase PrpD
MTDERQTVTRRSVLQAAGGLAAASLATRTTHAATQPTSDVMVRLSAYMTEARNRALPQEAVEQAQLHILDTFAAMVSGSELAPGRFAVSYARSHPGDKVATVAGSDVVCGTIDAAFANAMLAHSDETDDSHAPSQSHPGSSVVSAALAAGEQFNIGGTQFLRAVVLGYDIGTRFTMTVGVGGFETATHISTHALAGNFGSAAAAGSAASLTDPQMRWLLDYAAQQGSGIKVWQRDTDHIEKAFLFAGMPARNGMSAALIVQAGGTGVDDVLSGPDNFLAGYAPQADPAKLVEKLGERYEIAHTNVKKWSVGSPIQAPMDALQTLLKQHRFEADQVRKVVVRVATTEAALVNNREMPDICMQYMVAVMLLDRTASFKAAHDKPRMQEAAIQRERAKVQLVPDAMLERLMPARVAIVEVTLADGSTLTERVDAVRGTAENPMTREEVVAKCRDLMTPVLGAERCSKLIQTALDLDNLKAVRQLRPLLQRV